MHGTKLTVSQWIIAATIFTMFVLPVSISWADFDNNTWTWISGSDTALQPGTYGTQGEPAEDNVPGARYGSASWMDSAGNFWLFGGYGLDYDMEDIETRGYLNDLWRHDPDTGMWIWMSGSDMFDQSGIYGTKGEPAAENVPGARYGSVCWTDSTGNFWLFGGHGLDTTDIKHYMNDLWRYDPDTGMWTWVNGSDMSEQEGIYGTQGEPAAENVPGARYESASWTDSADNLWLLGGFGFDSDGRDDELNDLWRYDPDNGDNGTWTWMGGDDEILQRGYYGTQGEPSEDNRPGARYGSSSWTDSAGGFWLFGGYGLDHSGSRFYLNDLWRYDPDDGDNGTWTWVSGSDKVAKRGKYGAQGMPSEDNVPGARYDGVAWMDSTDTLWLFGGYGYADSGRNNVLNDLWRYDPDSDIWTWISGSDKTSKSGIYGIKGLPAVENVPGARNGSLAWMDADDNFWLFGGYGRDNEDSKTDTKEYMNDLWRYQQPSAMNMRIDTCTITAGKTDRINDDATDEIKFDGWMDAGEAWMNANMGGEIVISLLTDTVLDPDATTFSFPINEETFTNGTYKSPQDKDAGKNDPVVSFSYDSAKGTMEFSAKNVDLTGLYCPILVTIQIGAYNVATLLNEDLVNGSKTPCPLALMMGVWDSLDVEKFKAKKGSKDDSDSFDISGTFTIEGTFDTAQPVDIMLGPDTFSVPGSAFTESKGAYSCKKIDSGNGIVTATFDTVKATYSIKVKDASLNSSGEVEFSFDFFGNDLPSALVTMPDDF